MFPLLLVYIAEYTINQGVAPTLLFPLPQTPFKHYRAFYPTYNAIYQVGVFISRHVNTEIESGGWIDGDGVIRRYSIFMEFIHRIVIHHSEHNYIESYQSQLLYER